MFRISRNRLAGISSALAMALVLALMLVTAALGAKGPVVHHVLAGGPDACVAVGAEHPGCDGNFSLSAREYADGSVSGQYTDRFSQAFGGGGFHAVIDCLSVDGNDAWVSGVITRGTFPLGDGEVLDITGFPVAARVRDNGTSANDPPDQISFSNIGDPTPCTDRPTESPFYDLSAVPEGQVKVR
jgi:hypothetical protein